SWILDESGGRARVVSRPCWELFFEQPEEYRQQVLGDAPRISIEAAATFGWERIVDEHGLMIGIDHFGASAPDKVIAENLGFTPPAVADRATAFPAPPRRLPTRWSSAPAAPGWPRPINSPCAGRRARSSSPPPVRHRPSPPTSR